MRDLAVFGVVLLGMGATLRYPFVGVLLWAWLTLMVPHENAFGFAQSLPINLMVAVVTLLRWAFSNERKVPPLGTFSLVLLFLIWITINGFQAVDPGWSWPLWDRTWRIILFGILISLTATNRVRIHALIATIVLSLFYYGFKGGLFTLLTGGNYHVVGPDISTIGDNNHLALAILMVIPLANYLRMHLAQRSLRILMTCAMILSLISVLGSYSRGAFLALVGVLFVAWLRAKKKWLYPFVAAAVVIPALAFMPQSYVDRIKTIQTASSDASFEGRVNAWHVAFGYAKDHFPFGAGFSGPELPQVFGQYEPGQDTHAAHSIYFQVLGDNGFVGLAIYLLILLTCFWNSSVIRKRTKGDPELAWAFDLSGMVQLTLFIFCVGGAALSFAYYDLFFMCAGLLSIMRQMIDNQKSSPFRQRKNPVLPSPLEIAAS
jgi:probable O-glycosylation ligase (exosortase A-associated)